MPTTPKINLSFQKQAAIEVALFRKEAISADYVTRAARRYARANGGVLDDRIIKYLTHVGRWSYSRKKRVILNSLRRVLKPTISHSNEGGKIGVRWGLAKEYLKAWRKSTNNAPRPKINLQPGSYFTSNRISPRYLFGSKLKGPSIESTPNWAVLAHETGHAMRGAGAGGVQRISAGLQAPGGRLLEEARAWHDARKLLGNSNTWSKLSPEARASFYDTQRGALETYKNKNLGAGIANRFFPNRPSGGTPNIKKPL